MTPRTTGSKSEKKEKWIFFFDLNLKKTTILKTKEILLQYSFRNFSENAELYDLRASISLEYEFNASKFAKDLLNKYKFINEIEVRHL